MYMNNLEGESRKQKQGSEAGKAEKLAQRCLMKAALTGKECLIVPGP